MLGVARFLGSFMKMWSVSAMSTYSSVSAAGSLARNCVTACGRFMTGKPMSQLFSVEERQPPPGWSILAVTVGISCARASSRPSADESSRVKPVISVHGSARCSFLKW